MQNGERVTDNSESLIQLHKPYNLYEFSVPHSPLCVVAGSAPCCTYNRRARHWGRNQRILVETVTLGSIGEGSESGLGTQLTHRVIRPKYEAISAPNGEDLDPG